MSAVSNQRSASGLLGDIRLFAIAAIVATAPLDPGFTTRRGALIALVLAIPDLPAFRMRAADWLAVVVFPFVMLASSTWSERPLLTESVWRDQAYIAVLFLALRVVLTRRKAIAITAGGYLVGCAYALWRLHAENPSARLSLQFDVANSFTADGLNPNYIAYALAGGVGVAVLLSAVTHGKLPRVVVLVTAVLALYAGVGLTGARGAAVASVATFVWAAIAWLVPAARRVGLLVIYGATVVIAVCIFTGWTDGFLREQFRASIGRETGDLNGRLLVWPAARAVFNDHLWLGAGAGTFPGFNVRGIYAHDVLLDVASGVGLLGLVVYLGMIIALVLGTRGTEPDLRALLLGSAICCLAPPLLTGYWYQSPAAWIVIALFSRMAVIRPSSPSGYESGPLGAGDVQRHDRAPTPEGTRQLNPQPAGND